MVYEYNFLLSLVLTVIIETAVLFIIAKHFLKTKASNAFLIFLGIFCSSATLPYLWFILPIFVKSFYSYAAIGEVLVILAEAVIYYFVLRVNLKKALFISSSCNIISFLLGLIIARFFNF